METFSRTGYEDKQFSTTARFDTQNKYETANFCLFVPLQLQAG